MIFNLQKSDQCNTTCRELSKPGEEDKEVSGGGKNLSFQKYCLRYSGDLPCTLWVWSWKVQGKKYNTGIDLGNR
jgi:hypothetical protein